MALLSGKQIRDASIALAKLVQAADILLRDGSVALTGALNAGGQRLTNLGAPTSPSDAARLQDLHSIAWKDAVKAASTVNLTLSGEQTIDGVSCSTGDRVLAKDQTNADENGIYIVDSGAWSRAADFDSTEEVDSAVVPVSEGTVNADLRFAQTEDGVVIDTDDITFVNIGSGGSPAYPTSSNKNMTAQVTDADEHLATSTTIAATPAGDGHVEVVVNGKLEDVRGDKNGSCFFSGDSGSTARALSAIQAGDELYWLRLNAGYELDANDRIDFNYTV